MIAFTSLAAKALVLPMEISEGNCKQGRKSFVKKICSRKLTTCSVAQDGETVELGLVDQLGMPVAVEFPFEHAESMVMTLPQLLAWALRKRTGNENARYVFLVSNWSLEIADNQNYLILTLATADGFEVSLGIPPAHSRALSMSLHQEAGIIEMPARRQWSFGLN